MRASDKAYETLRNDIMEGILSPGQLIVEVEQSERIGVSRTPLREAIKRLLAEGLAEPNPGRGVIVSKVSLAKVHALFELRMGLDCTAAELAARKGNPAVFTALADRFARASVELRESKYNTTEYYALVSELDSSIDAAADNQYLLQAQVSLRNQLTRIRKLSKTNVERLVQAALEHAQIARAIASENPELAVAATKLHLHQALMAIEKAASQEGHELFDPQDSSRLQTA